MNPVTITVGVVTTAVKSALNGLRHQFKELREYINSDLGKTLVGAGLVEMLHKVVEEISEIAHVSHKFGILPETLQEIANAAKVAGVTMEDVGMGMNKMIISQEKVRKGNKELRDTLKDLHVDAEAFTNAKPDEAFYMIADAVHSAHDRTMAYAAVVQLMGRSAGTLFSTMEKGSEAIKEEGRSFGILSAGTVEQVHEMETAFNRLKSNTVVALGAIMGWLHKFVSSIEVTLAFMLTNVDGAIEGINKSVEQLFKGNYKAAAQNLKDAIKSIIPTGEEGKEQAKAYNEALDEIWNAKPEEHGEEGEHRDLMDTESEMAEKKKLQESMERLAKNRAKFLDEELEGQKKLNALIREQAEMEQKMGAEEDPQKKVDLEEENLELSKEIMQTRKKIDKESEESADRLAKRSEQMDQKRFEASIAGLDDDEKRAKLVERRGELEKQFLNAKGQEKMIDLDEGISDLEKQISEIDKKKKQPQLVTSTLGKIGGGGGAFVNHDDGTAKIVRAVEAAKTIAQQSKQVLEKIEKKTGKSLWNN